MNLQKAQQRLAKRAKASLNGYPQVSIAYYGAAPTLATKVVLCFVAEHGAAPEHQSFTTSTDIRFDETIQTTLLKIVERLEAKTLTLVEGVAPLRD
jgi:hypothetical protein